MSAKVLFLAPSAYLLSGLASWLDYLIPGLRNCGYDVVLGLVEGPRFHKPEKYLEFHPCDRIERFPCYTATPAGRRIALVKGLAHLRPDIALSVNIPDLLCSPLPLNCRRVMTIHGLIPQLFQDAETYRDVLDAICVTNRLTGVAAARVCGFNESRVYYAPYGSSPHAFRQDVLIREPLRIAYSGRLEQEQKRVRGLFSFCRRLDQLDVDYQLTIAGSGPEEGWLSTELSNHVASGKVQFVGLLDSGALQERVYAKCDILLITSSWETGPIVAWEAMLNGLLVLSSEYVGMDCEAALINHDTCLSYVVDDMAAAAERCRDVMSHPSQAHRIRKAGFEMAMGRYTQEASVKAWSECIHQLLSKPPLNPGWCAPLRPAGKLDRILSAGLAERVRLLAGRFRPPLRDAGSEWPHAHGSGCGLQSFLKRMADIESAFFANGRTK